mgnify:CR=1 FL=1
MLDVKLAESICSADWQMPLALDNHETHDTQKVV